MATESVENSTLRPELNYSQWKASSFYKDALNNMVMYNTQLTRERKSRLPYFDGQTGVLQRECHLWRKESERMVGQSSGQIYTYTAKRWRLEPPELPPLPPPPPPPPPQQPLSKAPSEGSDSNHGTLSQSLEGGGNTAPPKRSSRLALKRDDTISSVSSSRVTMESPISSELNEEQSDKEVDFIDDYDSEEEKKPRKKRKTTARSKPPLASSQKPTRDIEKEKPFLCATCNRRYKTQASLKAHQTSYHGGEVPPVPIEKPPVLTPVVGGVLEKILESNSGQPVKKRNPYCDFCLGDESVNQKLGKPEKMVSCADCGRSGHPSCLQFSPALAAVVLTYRWQCIECKSCSLCGKSDNDDQLLFCDDCDRGYHMYCLKPPMKEAPEGQWSCGMC